MQYGRLVACFGAESDGRQLGLASLAHSASGDGGAMRVGRDDFVRAAIASMDVAHAGRLAWRARRLWPSWPTSTDWPALPRTATSAFHDPMTLAGVCPDECVRVRVVAEEEHVFVPLVFEELERSPVTSRQLDSGSLVSLTQA